jgi:hypothetical protein
LTDRAARGSASDGNERAPEFSEEKLQQVILYSLERINNVHAGRTKLMKLLYFVDSDHAESCRCQSLSAPKPAW